MNTHRQISHVLIDHARTTDTACEADGR